MELGGRETKMQIIQLLAARFGTLQAAFHSFKNREGLVTKMNLLKGVRTYLGLAPSYGYELLQIFSGESGITCEDWVERLTSYVPAAESPTEPPSPLPVFPASPAELSDIELATEIDLESQADSLCSLPLREDEEEVAFPPRPTRSQLTSPRQSISVLEALARTTSQLRRSRHDLHKRLITAKHPQLRLY